MKKYLYLAIVIVSLSFCPFSVVKAASGKIALVDLQKCMRESVEGKRKTEELRKKKDAMQRRHDEKEGELLKLQEEFKKQSMMLSLEARVDKERFFEKKRRKFNFLVSELKEEMKEAETKAIESMIKELGTLVNDIGKKGNYQMILQKTGGVVVYFDEAIDITDQVIKAYDRIKR